MYDTNNLRTAAAGANGRNAGRADAEYANVRVICSHRASVSPLVLVENRPGASAALRNISNFRLRGQTPISCVTFGAKMMKLKLLSTAILCGPLCAALTPPSSPRTARGLTTLAAGASGPQRQIHLVAAGVLAKSGRVLLQQRSDPPQLAGLWEFPGGKVDPGETLEKALARELDEELAVKVEETDLEPIAFTSHPLDDARNLLMPVYGVLAWAGEPVGAEGQPLAWVTADELGSDAYPMPPADYPLVDPVRQFLRRRERSGKRWRLVAPVRRLLRRRN